MSWYTKVVWSEGLFLRPHHLQQSDRYHEHLLESRVRASTPYPWGFSELEIDRDLAQQSKFALRRAAGIMPDGTPFSIPADSPLPPAIIVPEAAAGQIVWLLMPIAAANTREADDREAESAARYITGAETFIDSSSLLRVEEEIDLAFPRLCFELRKTAKPGYIGLGIARITEVRDKTIVFDEKYVPPVLLCHAHPAVEGWIDRAIGWIDNKLEELARYAADPTAGGGLQSVEYLVLQLLNRHIAVLRHFRNSSYVHPERLFEEFLRLVGELATFATAERRARTYPHYDQDDLENVFGPVMRDLQDFLSAQLGRRAIRLEIIQLRPNAFSSPIRDRSLFRNATLVLEVAARRPLVEIQNDFPHLFKVGPTPICRACRWCTCRRRRRIFVRSPITCTSTWIASRRCGRNSARRHRSGCTSRATGLNSNCICGRFWKIANDRQGQAGKSVRPGRADHHTAQSRGKAAAGA
jgi:type VI secretion system protein ImpJ